MNDSLLTPDVTLTLTIDEARALAKSISISLDKLLEKRSRLHPNTPTWQRANDEYRQLDNIYAQLREGIADHVEGVAA